MRRHGAEGLPRLTLAAGIAQGVMTQERDVTEVLMDTMVKEKAITYPTDSKTVTELGLA